MLDKRHRSLWSHSSLMIRRSWFKRSVPGWLGRCQQEYRRGRDAAKSNEGSATVQALNWDALLFSVIVLSHLPGHGKYMPSDISLSVNTFAPNMNALFSARKVASARGIVER